MNVAEMRETHPLLPHEVVAELVALSVVEYSHAEGVSIAVAVNGVDAAISDTGRGMRLEPDPGDTIGHATRAMTSIYPIHAGDPAIEQVLVDLVWHDRGSLGPALANAACPTLAFTSSRDGATWTQRFRFGESVGPPSFIETSDRRGTAIRCTTAGPIDVEAVDALVTDLRTRIPDLRLDVTLD